MGNVVDNYSCTCICNFRDQNREVVPITCVYFASTCTSLSNKFKNTKFSQSVRIRTNFDRGFRKICGYKNCGSTNTLFSPNNGDVNIGLSRKLFSDRQRSF